MTSFTAIVERGDGPGYGVFFPDLPGCTSSTGDTVDHAAQQAEEALALHLAGMIEDGETIPVPSDPEAIAVDPAVREVCRLWVRVAWP